MRPSATAIWKILTVLVVLMAGGVVARPAPSQGPERPAEEIWLFDTNQDSLVQLTSRSGPGRESRAASVSGDGNKIVFQSDSDFLGEGLANGTDEIWLFDVPTSELTRVTSASDSQRDSGGPVISADGNWVAFESDSDLLGEGLSRGQREIWLYDIAAGAVTRLTRAPGRGSSGGAAITADGSRVAFHSTADLDGGEPQGRGRSIWLHDVASGSSSPITPPSVDGVSMNPDISADGSRIVFESDADLLGEGLPRGGREIWIFDATAGTFARISTSSGRSRASEAPSISADGTTVVFHSDADLLDEGRPDSVDEIWLYDVATTALRRVTKTWDPVEDAAENPVLHPDSQNPTISADASKIIFASDEDFLGEGLPNGHPHVWVYRLADESLTRVDTSRTFGSGMAISADAGRIVLFRTGFDQIRRARVAAVNRPPRPTTLSGDAIARDLAALQEEIESRWAYLETTGVDYRAAIDSLRRGAANGLGYDEYGIELQKIISAFVDGHAGVGGFRYPGGYLPFLVEPSGGRFVAFKPDRSGFLDRESPYIRAIDGRGLPEWVDAAAPFSPRGSPQYVTRQALRQIRSLQFQRSVMGIPESETVTVQLVSDDGSRTNELTLPVSDRGPVYGLWPPTETGIIDGDVGYLRIGSMNDEAVRLIQEWMPRLRETRGLIVDVRGNGGGLRGALRALFPYLMSEADAPHVANTAKYRLHTDHAPDHLGGSRFMYRADWEGWTPDERAAIRSFAAGFEPEWSPPEEEFSEWHYLVLSQRTNPDAYSYGRPAIILLDPKSFSATDIFVGAFKGWHDVTLVGSPSGGGSARRVGIRLPESDFSIGFASMASFQPSGLLYDGNGVAPDVVVDPAPEYFLAGGRDNILERALELLR